MSNDPRAPFFCWIPLLLGICLCQACTRTPSPVTDGGTSHQLTMMPTFDDDEGVKFMAGVLKDFQRKTGIQTASIDGYDDMDTRLDLYKRLFARHSAQPDICEIDNIWPALLADDLIDLKPYLGDEIKDIDQQLLDAFTVRGKLVGLPVVMDTAMLYYRTDLLQKYGYTRPPQTWDELGTMALQIQTGERKAGRDNFWGYVWQGAQGETLNCNALEWERAEGAPAFDGSDASCVRNAETLSAWSRARGWVGSISPPGVVEYDEEDSASLWLAGSAAFSRSWTSLYGASSKIKALEGRFAAAPLPAGKKGRAWIFGGMALGVSRYSRHPSEAAAVVRYFVSAAVQRQSLLATAELPTQRALLANPALLRHTCFEGWMARHWNEGLFNRPAASLGHDYPAYSAAYSAAVHDAISGRQTPRDALAHLQSQLEQMVRRRKRSQKVARSAETNLGSGADKHSPEA